jgi:hypothetical protein
MKKALFFFIPLVLILGACATTAPKPEVKKTQLEIRELQTRSYDTKDVKMVMKAVMHALQDDNFIIQQANIDLGLLTAQKEVDLEKVAEEEGGEGLSLGQALAIGAAVVAVGAAIVILGKKNKSDNDDSGVYRNEPHPTGRDEEPTFEKTGITEASVNISEFGDKTRVRINFRLKILDNKGGTAEVKQIDDPKFYQTFFSKVDKAVFLGKENVQ